MWFHRSVWLGPSVVCMALSLAAPAAFAQWAVTNLNPPGAVESRVWSAANGRQVGWAIIGNRYRAAAWTGDAGSFQDLTPSIAVIGGANAIDGDLVGGSIRANSVTHAAIWQIGASSWTDLHPSIVFHSSLVVSMADGQQAGYVQLPSSSSRASLWSGTAASWVNLQPENATSSVAYGTHLQQQVGFAIFSGRTRASLWTGTAESWIDLSPIGSIRSEANAVFNGQQVGYAEIAGTAMAGLWTGSAGSWLNLHPVGFPSSHAYATCGTLQAGIVAVNGETRPVIWSGTSESVEFLPLPSGNGWGNVWARSIHIEHGIVYVAGYGYNGATGRDEALLWSRPVPAPAASVLLLLGAALRQRRRAA